MSLVRPLLRPVLRDLVRNPLERGSGGWTPAMLFRASEQGGWWDPSDFSSMSQDSAGATPVTATGQPVGKINDKSGRGNHLIQATSAARPVLQQDASGYYYLSFDGVDDRLSSAAAVNLSVTAALGVWAGVYKSAAAREIIICHGTSFDTAGSFEVDHGNLASSYAFFANGNSRGECYTAANYAPPISNVVYCGYDTTQATNALEITPRINGASPAINSRAGTAGDGNFGSLTLTVGSSGSGSTFFSGRLYQLVIRGTLNDGATVQATERFVGRRMGITL